MPAPLTASRTGVALLLALGLGGVAGCASGGTAGSASTPDTTTAGTPATTSSPRNPAPPARSTPSTPHAPKSTSAAPRPVSVAQLRATAAATVARIAAGQPGGAISVAAFDETTGRSFAAGARSGMRMASVYKLFVVESLLLQDRDLSDGETDSVTAALEHSDNVAGYQLFIDAGGQPGLIDGARALGMTHTEPAANDPTFTTTGATDALQMLRVLVSPGGPFDADTRSFVLQRMSEVEDDQRWGVGAVADRGTTFYNKNGWLSIDDDNPPGDRDDDLWAVSSVGIVTVHGHRVLMAVFTQHQPSYAGGVALVERLARAITPAVSG